MLNRLTALNAAKDYTAVQHSLAMRSLASEVKSLASQTAKATDEISEQIADIQKVAGDAVEAIKGIGSIIGEANEVATAIAAAVQEQGAATEEITRSTQHAAQGAPRTSLKTSPGSKPTPMPPPRRPTTSLRDAGNPEPATWQSGDPIPGQDPRGLTGPVLFDKTGRYSRPCHSAATTGTCR
jgi:hypothetical protein